MYRLVLLFLLAFASISQAQYYRPTYSGTTYYRPSYTYPTYTAPSYYTPPAYTASSYSKPAEYSYEWSEAGWFRGRWYPAGYYYWDGHCYYLKGYGSFAGYERAPAPTYVKPPEPQPPPMPPAKDTASPLTPAEIATLKELLRKLDPK